MIKWLCKQTIRVNLLVMFLLLVTIPIVLSVGQNYYFQRTNLVEMTEERLDGVALGHSKLVSQWFQDKRRIVKSFSTDPTLNTKNDQLIKELLLNIKESNPEYKVVSYVDINGQVVSSTFGHSHTNNSDRTYFKEAISGKDAISDILISRAYKMPGIIFASPVKDKGKVIGVLMGSVDLKELQKIVDVSYEGETFKSFLAGDNGNYIVPPVNKVGVPNILIPIDKNYLSLIKESHSFGIIHANVDGSRKFVAFRRIPEARATIMVQQDELEATESINGQGLKNNIFLTSVIILLVVPLAFWLAKKISSPLEQISSSLREIAQGDFGQRITFPLANQEVRVIADDINLLGEQLQDFHVTIEQQIIDMDEQKWEITIRNQELLGYQEIIKEQIAELEEHKVKLQSQNSDLLLTQMQLERGNVLLKQMANTDQLTGLYNRRFLTAKLYEQIASSLAYNQDLCIAMLDIDYFKKVNDTYGHKTGDQVLKEVAELIRKTIRETDVVARFGGEEFIILFNTGIDNCKAIAEKVREVVENYNLQTDMGNLKITVSIGLATLSEYKEFQSIEQIEDCLFITADKNLYIAKELGRNRVIG